MQPLTEVVSSTPSTLLLCIHCLEIARKFFSFVVVHSAIILNLKNIKSYFLHGDKSHNSNKVHWLMYDLSLRQASVGAQCVWHLH